MTATTETWLDVMRAAVYLPLGLAHVPVRHRKQPWRACCHGLREGLRGREILIATASRVQIEDQAYWFVDLAEQQGFSYALTSLIRHNDGELPPNGHPLLRDEDDNLSGVDWDDLLWRHLRGTTTDADRLAVAKGLREVTS